MSIILRPKFQAFDDNGDPLSGGKVYFYEPGTTTPKDTYSDSSLTTANSNPVILDSRGEAEIYGSGSYRVILDDANDVQIEDIDNVIGISSFTAQDVEEWVATGHTPTYISSTSFSVPNDRTDTYQAGRRVRISQTSGTVYGTILSSAYSTLTTVNVYIDGSGSVDSGIDTVDVGLITQTNQSFPIKTIPVASAGGTVDAITANFTPAVPLIDEVICSVVAAGANTSTTPTFAPDGQTAKTITRNGNQALIEGDIYGSGHKLLLQYDSSNDVWELLNPHYPISITSAQISDRAQFVTDADYPFIDSTEFDIDSNLTEGSWESIGPTGSGADNIWTALDSVPTNADWIELHIYNSGTESTPGTSNTHVSTIYGRASGSSITPTERQSISRMGISSNASGDSITHVIMNTHKIQLSASNTFECRWESVFSSTNLSFSLIGYGYN